MLRSDAFLVRARKAEHEGDPLVAKITEAVRGALG